MKRGEIWLINLDPTVGAEIRKTRPVIIVNDDHFGILPLRVIVPITDWKERYLQAPWMVKVEVNSLTNLSKTSSADCFQIRSVSQDRFIRQIGEVDDIILGNIENALSKVLKIN